MLDSEIRLYVLRTALTGAHLLRTGELITDVTLLLDDYELGAARDLVAVKRTGERVEERTLDGLVRRRIELESRYDALDRLVEQRATARPGEGEALRKTLVERAGTGRNSPIASTLLVVRPPTYAPEHPFGFGSHTGAVGCTARLECYH